MLNDSRMAKADFILIIFLTFVLITDTWCFLGSKKSKYEVTPKKPKKTQSYNEEYKQGEQKNMYRTCSRNNHTQCKDIFCPWRFNKWAGMKKDVTKKDFKITRVEYGTCQGDVCYCKVEDVGRLKKFVYKYKCEGGRQTCDCILLEFKYKGSTRSDEHWDSDCGSNMKMKKYKLTDEKY